MDVQFQIRQNALELQDYMRDLVDWEKDVSKRDAKLKKGLVPKVEAPRCAPRARRRRRASGSRTDPIGLI